MSEQREDPGPPILEAIARRWSPRAWADRPVEAQKLIACLEAARWGASSMNQQPWRFIVATRDDQDDHERLAQCLKESNRAWARHAPVLMLSACKETLDNDDRPNRFAWHDTGLATAALMIQATALGLRVHAMGGFSRTKAREAFGVPDGFEPVAAIAMGYVGDPDSLPAELRDPEIASRPRNPMTEWVFSGAWGLSAHLR